MIDPEAALQAQKISVAWMCVREEMHARNLRAAALPTLVASGTVKPAVTAQEFGQAMNGFTVELAKELRIETATHAEGLAMSVRDAFKGDDDQQLCEAAVELLLNVRGCVFGDPT